MSLEHILAFKRMIERRKSKQHLTGYQARRQFNRFYNELEQRSYFEHPEALEQAAELFWERGFEEEAVRLLDTGGYLENRLIIRMYNNAASAVETISEGEVRFICKGVEHGILNPDSMKPEVVSYLDRLAQEEFVLLETMLYKEPDGVLPSVLMWGQLRGLFNKDDLHQQVRLFKENLTRRNLRVLREGGVVNEEDLDDAIKEKMLSYDVAAAARAEGALKNRKAAFVAATILALQYITENN